MSDAIITSTTHPDYDLVKNDLQAIRDCVDGSEQVKRGTYTYLPHPSQIDPDSREQEFRYKCYLYGAEFDGFPDDTRREMIGKMKISDTTIDLPEKLNYLINDSNGDGSSLQQAIEFAVNNVIQTKWHILIADVKGAPKSTEGMSRADVAALKVRTTIKQYTRENVVNWNFARVNGVMQLSYIKLLELSDDLSAENGTHNIVENYLVLALDEDGNYYQQTIQGGSGEGVGETSDRNYPRVGGKLLEWLPVVVMADETLSENKFPIQLGYLNSICLASLHRYRASADYKESQRNLAPTIMTSGWKQGDIDIFKEANNQRSYIATGAGAVNNMPEGVTSDVLSTDMAMEDYHWYFEYNEKKIRSMGGSANTQGVTMTATEADINASKQNALLNTIADNAEQSFKRAALYCGMFEGVYSLDDLESNLDDVVIELPRDFATPKLSVDETKVYLDMQLQGIISRDRLLEVLTKGGWLAAEIDELILESSEISPPIQPNESVTQ